MDILRSPYYKDIPKAFKLENNESEGVLVGAYAKLIKHFADYMNYTLELVQETDYKMSDIQKNIEKNIFNISLNSGFYENRFAHIDFSYPLEWTYTCVMVPAKDELPRYWYIAWPFGRYIWLFMGLSVIYVAYVMTYLKHPTTAFGSNLLYSMSLVMYNSSANLLIKNLPLRLQLFYTLLLVMGFIMSSYYCSYLTMYNMRPVFQPFIKSIDDALQANIQILISSSIVEQLSNNEYVNLKPLKKLLVETTASDVSNKIKAINRSFGYVVPRTQWIFMSKLQRNLIQPVYQLSDICFGNYLNTYPIQLNAKFADDLNIFIMLIQQSGLWELWEDQGFLLALSYESYALLEDIYPVDPLNLYYYRIAWIILIGGLVLSMICFVTEIFVFKSKLRFKAKCCKNEIKV